MTAAAGIRGATVLLPPSNGEFPTVPDRRYTLLRDGTDQTLSTQSLPPASHLLGDVLRAVGSR